jgi:hypothetical protein
MSDADRLKRLSVALYKFRSWGVFRDLPNKDGNRLMRADAFAELMKVFCNIEREKGIDPGTMDEVRRAAHNPRHE